MDTSVGNLLIDDALPEDMRKPAYNLDKKGTHALFQELAEKHPDQYKEVLQKLNNIGRDAAYNSGQSVSLSALKKSPAKERVLSAAKLKVQQIVNDDSLPDAEKDKAIIDTLMPLGHELTEQLFQEAKDEGNPFYAQIMSGSRGKKSDFNSLRGAELLTSDHNGKIIPVPMLNSYADGLDPVEYFAGMYAQRRGAIGVKMGTGEAGFMNKKIVNAAHRLVVDKEAPEATRLPVGLPVSVDDHDNVGAVLAKDAGPYKAGTTLTKPMLDELKHSGEDEVIIHSAMTESSADGGISRLAAGNRDRFGLSRIGDNIGIPAAQAIGEKLSQGMLSKKHQSGMAQVKGGREGFEYLNRLVEAPETFPESGPLAAKEGYVKSIKKAPQGGHYIMVDDHEHYSPAGISPTVTEGQHVDAGDDLTDGVPHPAELLQHRGIGEARRVYMNLLKEALDNSGIQAHRRNLEPVVAGLMNWAKVTSPEGVGEHLPDDVTSYNTLAHHYKPREDAQLQPVRHAIGRYLEEPALHHSIGTKVTKKMADQFDKHGIKDLYTHHEPPGFEPHFQRGILGVHSDPDWQTSLSGFYTTSAFQKGVERGATSDPNSSSFVSALSKGTDFGKNLSTTGKYGA